MYPVSEAYKNAISQNERNVRITGTITLKDSSIINISDEDILQGSLYFTEQCVSGEDIEIGNVYASELGLTLTSPPENPYSLDGARIIINFGINVEPDPEEDPLWEYVPLGYFYVTEIERKQAAVNLKALDGMILFDVDLSGVLTTGNPFALISSCCTKAGVSLATSSSEFQNFANGLTAFTIPSDSKIETCRDLIMWVCQITGTFARMNRMGQLEVVPITSGASVKTITKPERFTSNVSDFEVKVTKVAMKIGEAEYSQGAEGMTMTLEENPLLINKEPAEINAALNELLDQVTLAEYVPYSLDFAGDPAIQAGDWVTLADTARLGGGDVTSLVTHTSWRYRGSHNLKGVGKSGLLKSVFSQQNKTVSSIAAIAKAAQDIAQAANQSTQLINDAIGGHVLIRREPGGTNEILIMDHEDPDQARKIWRWNMGGLGYSDNVTGADNPARQYTIAMTMDGTINADFIKTGILAAEFVQIGPGTSYAEGYDPSSKPQIWYYPHVPTLDNLPASEWSPEEMERHIGDLFYDTSPGYAYRFKGLAEDMLYYKGKEYAEIVEGQPSIGNGYQSKEADHLLLVAQNELPNDTAERTYTFPVPVNLTGVNEIFINWENAGTGDGIFSRLSLQTSPSVPSVGFLSVPGAFGRRTDVYDVSAINGERYIRIHSRVFNEVAIAASVLKVYAIGFGDGTGNIAWEKIEDGALHEHNNTPSPHNLPAEITMGPYGIKMTVQEVDRVTLGQHAPGKWGLQVKNAAGDATVLDEDGLLQSWCDSIADNVDADHPLKIKFYIPEEALSVRKVKLNFTLEAFRAYSTGAASGGGHTTPSGGGHTTPSGGGHTSSSAGAHRHMMFSYSSQGTTGTANQYAAQNYLGEMMLVGLSGPTGSSIYTYGAAENHTHSVYAHTHTVSNHSHTVSNHTHPIRYGIYTSTTATGVRVYVDGVERFGPFTTGQTDLDLTPWITTTGWHTVELSSTRLGRISATYFVQVFLAS